MTNEMRLIDANALMKRFYNYYDCVNEFTSKNGYRGETLMNYEVADMIYDCIDNAPTVDAEIVKHGRWIIKYIKNSKYHYAYCSECETMGSPQWKRCPVCEAKMDGERKDK